MRGPGTSGWFGADELEIGSCQIAYCFGLCGGYEWGRVTSTEYEYGVLELCWLLFALWKCALLLEECMAERGVRWRIVGMMCGRDGA